MQVHALLALLHRDGFARSAMLAGHSRQHKCMLHPPVRGLTFVQIFKQIGTIADELLSKSFCCGAPLPLGIEVR